MKTTPLPSVKKKALAFKEFYCECNGSMTPDAIYATTHQIITQRDDQAYTRLVEGIGGLPTHHVYPDKDSLNFVVYVPLTDILENVVKPLYNKTGDN